MIRHLIAADVKQGRREHSCDVLDHAPDDIAEKRVGRVERPVVPVPVVPTKMKKRAIARSSVKLARSKATGKKMMTS